MSSCYSKLYLYSYIIFFLFPKKIPDLFQRNFVIDLVATTCGCGLLMGTVRSLYGAWKIKNYADPVEANKAFEKREGGDKDKVEDITKSRRYW